MDKLEEVKQEVLVKLDLDNFDRPEFSSCPYILTSPRSLQACSQLGMKPVELIPVTASDLQQQYPQIPHRQLQAILVRHNRIRLLRLIEARRLRRTLPIPPPNTALFAARIPKSEQSELFYEELNEEESEGQSDDCLRNFQQNSNVTFQTKHEESIGKREKERINHELHQTDKIDGEPVLNKGLDVPTRIDIKGQESRRKESSKAKKASSLKTGTSPLKSARESPSSRPSSGYITDCSNSSPTKSSKIKLKNVKQTKLDKRKHQPQLNLQLKGDTIIKRTTKRQEVFSSYKDNRLRPSSSGRAKSALRKRQGIKTQAIPAISKSSHQNAQHRVTWDLKNDSNEPQNDMSPPTENENAELSSLSEITEDEIDMRESLNTISDTYQHLPVEKSELTDSVNSISEDKSVDNEENTESTEEDWAIIQDTEGNQLSTYREDDNSVGSSSASELNSSFMISPIHEEGCSDIFLDSLGANYYHYPKEITARNYDQVWKPISCSRNFSEELMSTTNSIEERGTLVRMPNNRPLRRRMQICDAQMLIPRQPREMLEKLYKVRRQYDVTPNNRSGVCSGLFSDDELSVGWDSNSSVTPQHQGTAPPNRKRVSTPHKRKTSRLIRAYRSSSSLNKLGLEDCSTRTTFGLSGTSSMSSLTSSLPPMRRKRTSSSSSSKDFTRIRHTYNRPTSPKKLPSSSSIVQINNGVKTNTEGNLDQNEKCGATIQKKQRRELGDLTTSFSERTKLPKSSKNINRNKNTPKVFSDVGQKQYVRRYSGTNSPKKPKYLPYLKRISLSDDELGSVRKKRFNDQNSTICSRNGLKRSSSTNMLGDNSFLDKIIKGYAGNVELPMHDRRILQLLALKLQRRRETELKAAQLQKRWQLQSQKEREISSKRWAEYREEVMAKRKAENEENEMRWRHNRDLFLQSQENLTVMLKGKDERSREMLNRRDTMRIQRGAQKAAKEAEKLESVKECRRRQRIEEEVKRQQLIHMWDQHQKLVEKRKQEREEASKKRYTELGEEEAAKHAARALIVEQRGQQLLEELKTTMNEKLKRASDNLKNLKDTKERLICASKYDRERRLTAAQALHQQMEAALLHWRQTVLHKQQAAATAAEQRLKTFLEKKTITIREQLQTRQQIHSKRLQQETMRFECEKQTILEAARARSAHADEAVRRKEEQKMRGRIIANTTATLRAAIRHELDPSTFDRVAARAALDLRIGSRPKSAAPSLHLLNTPSSHVYLG